MAMSKTTPMFMSDDHISIMNGDDDEHDDDDEHIIATNIIINPTDCDEPCDSIVTVTWKNIGKRQKFRPAIKVNGTIIELDIEIILNKNQTTTQTFNLTNIMEGTYIICPYPN